MTPFKPLNTLIHTFIKTVDNCKRLDIVLAGSVIPGTYSREGLCWLNTVMNMSC